MRSLLRSMPLLALVLVGLLPRNLWPGDGATITFRKIFKSSFPEFVEIRVNEAGQGTYDIRQLDEEASAQPFEISRPLVQKIFALAAQLHYFQNLDLDVHRRVANLGQKRFRYEKDGIAHEVSFNYTINSSADQLLTIFEGLARQQEDLSDLERTMRYDRLGVDKVVLHLEADFNSKSLPDPGRLLPALDQVAADDHFLDIARQRARALAERIRNPH
jgi:hypothetical protein